MIDNRLAFSIAWNIASTAKSFKNSAPKIICLLAYHFASFSIAQINCYAFCAGSIAIISFRLWPINRQMNTAITAISIATHINLHCNAGVLATIHKWRIGHRRVVLLLPNLHSNIQLGFAIA